LLKTPGVDKAPLFPVYSLLSSVTDTYHAFFFVTLKEWKERKSPEEHVQHIIASANRALTSIPEGRAFVFPAAGNPRTAPPGRDIQLETDPVRMSFSG